MSGNTLTIDLASAKRLYTEATGSFKNMLEQTFTQQQLNESIIDQVQSMDDIFRIGGKTLQELTNPNDTPDEIAYKVLKLGVAVLNEGKLPDHSNGNQTKFEPRFYDDGSGRGLSYYDYGLWPANTLVGPRLCYLNYDAMLHGVEIMKDYYHTFYNLKK